MNTPGLFVAASVFFALSLTLFQCGGAPPGDPSPPTLADPVSRVDAGSTPADPPPSDEDAGSPSEEASLPPPAPDSGTPAPSADAGPDAGDSPSTADSGSSATPGTFVSIELPADVDAGVYKACTDPTAPDLCKGPQGWYCTDTHSRAADNCTGCGRSCAGGNIAWPSTYSIPTISNAVTTCIVVRGQNGEDEPSCGFECGAGFVLCGGACVAGTVCP